MIVDITLDCRHCVHCDTREVTILKRGREEWASPGVCTLMQGFHNGRAVLGWYAKGCPGFQNKEE